MLALLRRLAQHSRVRAAAVGAGALVSLYILLASVHGHYPLQHWLVWRYLQAWVFALVFTVSCLSAGLLTLRLTRTRLPLLEGLLFSMAIGVLAFAGVTFVGGLLGLLSPAFAVATPIVVGAPGALGLWRRLRRSARHLRAAHRRAAPAGFWATLALCLGVLGLVAVYLLILHPENASYDARWYHLALPEHYMAAGGIVRFPEGWLQGALPQLTSILYLWPYQFSGLGLFGLVGVAAHLEFVLFLWTLAGVPVLVRWLVPQSRVLVSWSAFFLFSALFVYDSMLSLAADHVAAFWTIPIFLALRRAWAQMALPSAALLGAMCGGAALTKYQVIQVVAVALAAFAARGSWLVIRRLWRKSGPSGAAILRAFALLSLTFLVVFSPHWLKNWIWYGDPLYPVLHQHLTLHPWGDDASAFHRAMSEAHFWRPKGTAWEKLDATFRALFTFSFVPHNWAHLHGLWPVFGFLFTLSWPLLPFLRGGRRLWPLFLASHAAITLWFLFSHQDRYLQIIMPWMVAHVAAVIALTWRLGWLARGPLLLLLAGQTVWGMNVLAVPSHIYLRNRWQDTALLFSGSYRREYPQRYRVFSAMQELGRATPKDARLLLHRFEPRAGIRRMFVTGHPHWQGQLSYGRYESHAELHQDLLDLGVSHVVWREDEWHAEDSLAGDLRFAGFVSHVLGQPQNLSGSLLAAMPPQPPPDTDSAAVLYLGCTHYKPGMYELPQLHHPGKATRDIRYPDPVEAVSADNVATLLQRANYLVTDAKCGHPKLSTHGFVRRATRRGEVLMVRQVPLRTAP